MVYFLLWHGYHAGRGNVMGANSIIYIIGAVVVIIVVLKLLGLY